MLPRYGGELPLGCDVLASESQPLGDAHLGFSHGRAALRWLLEHRGPFESVAYCAYTCPSVPKHFDRYNLKTGIFDHGESDLIAMLSELPGRCLVLLPAPFGMAPWVDPIGLACAAGGKAMVLVDAAQSAFGHLDFAVPPGGAVLSGPRKALAIGDGAILAVERVTEEERESVSDLPTARDAIHYKQSARALFATGDPASEVEALDLNKRAEAAWPARAHRMSEQSLAHLAHVDRRHHQEARRQNARRLGEQLAGRFRSPLGTEGTPFNFPILVENRGGLLECLHARRVFATPLWPDCRHDPARHPVAADFAERLLALPVDQRYSLEDMDVVAETLLACL